MNKKNNKNYFNKEWLLMQYCEKHLSVSKIADECEVGFTTISRWLERFEIREKRPYNADRKGVKAPFWRGGRYKDNHSGYVWVYNPEHPLCNKRGYVLEHRLAMEKFIGRHLRGNEIIHHKNKKKDDNRINNLEIIFIGEPNCGKIICPFCNKEFKMG
ncbi:HNH endonuclease [Patescibacteria group bacterium]|nr:HNH endonuclease [Patescibacteria group bacterium]MBU4368019.1 HNH endonuclease [Patescibacteria group bacterium]MBU4462254.1 HNH endonuclease [Patescibacteria group bacterium]MCG2699610.1 HNH endonuclease [Candidatus Parcubacteria bacterium]